jgi:hypothetical protein
LLSIVFLHLLRGRFLLLIADAAEHWAALGWPEGDRRLLAALCAGGASLRTHSGASLGALRLARLAVLGVVLELFIVEEELFAGGEYKLGVAIDAS